MKKNTDYNETGRVLNRLSVIFYYLLLVWINFTHFGFYIYINTFSYLFKNKLKNDRKKERHSHREQSETFCIVDRKAVPASVHTLFK